MSIVCSFLRLCAFAFACWGLGSSRAETLQNVQVVQEELSDADKASYAEALAYCRWNVPKPVALRDDQRVLCFDGAIEVPSDLAAIDGLVQGGLFVVRSAGGDARVAMQLADILRSKQAIVIVNDYCLANCANYLFFASFTTFVPKDALVAWSFVKEPGECIERSRAHDYGTPRFGPCSGIVNDGRLNEEIDQLKRKFYEGRVRSSEQSHAGFLRDGSRNQDLIPPGPSFELPPRSAAVLRSLKDRADARGRVPPVYWTWNPRFYPSVITTRVFYEAYPQSQDELDTIAKRVGVRVIYDP